MPITSIVDLRTQKTRSYSVAHKMLLYLCVILVTARVLWCQAPVGSALDSNSNNVEVEASAFIDRVEEQMRVMAVKATFASWNFESNITEQTKKVNTELFTFYLNPIPKGGGSCVRVHVRVYVYVRRARMCVCVDT